MKKILLSLICVTFFSGANAQSFSLQDTNGVVVNPGSTVHILGVPTGSALQAFFYLKNISGVEKEVKVKKVINDGDTLSLTDNYFCWGSCFPPDVYETVFPQTIEPDSLSQLFYADYIPAEVIGTSTIMYVFFDSNDRDDSLAVIIKFNASPAAVNDEPTKQGKISDAYPNPAINFLNVDYSISGSVNEAAIVITNMLGSRVKEVNLDDRSGKAQIPVSELINGIYFYSLVADGKLILTKKFVVKR